MLEVDVWSDFLCPWCYVASARVEWLAADERIVVRRRPFELHPEVPLEGRPTARVYGHGDRARAERALRGFATLAAEEGLGWQHPERVPNTRRALGVDEWLRRNRPGVHPGFHVGVFDAIWAAGRDIGDDRTLAELVDRAGGDAEEALIGAADAVAGGWLEESRAEAQRRGVTGTPAFAFGQFVVPGLQDRPFFERIIDRLAARED